jgi:hypothetical protein
VEGCRASNAVGEGDFDMKNLKFGAFFLGLVVVVATLVTGV